MLPTAAPTNASEVNKFRQQAVGGDAVPIVQSEAFIGGVAGGGVVLVVAVLAVLWLCVERERRHYIKVPMAPEDKARCI
jgi:hypothetical protein